MRIHGSILLGLLILAGARPGAAQETGPAPAARSWSGANEDLETEPFPIRSGHWRIDWDTRNAEPGSYLVITVRHESGAPITTLTHQQGGSGSDPLETRPGIYYLEVTGVDLDWTIAVAERNVASESGPPTLPVQACAGRGTVGGQRFVETEVGFGSGDRLYSVGGGYDGRGPTTVSFMGFFGDSDGENPDFYGGGGTILIQVTGQPLNVCPTAALSYSRLERIDELEELGLELDLDVWRASAGVAFGVAVPAGDSGVFLMPFAVPSLLAVHGRGSVEFGGEVEEDSETRLEIGATGGLFFGGSRLYGGVSVTGSTIEGSDPTFGLGFGVAF